MTVQARFFIQSIARTAGNYGGAQVLLQPVCRGKENSQWAAATPSGRIELTVNNPDAAEWFNQRLGKELAISFDDRPALCTHCGEEVDALRPGSEGYGGPLADKLVHIACYEDAKKSKG